ncbi:MAG TPA: carbonic anhydrase [Candidatus Methylomirabilis sp.]|nr:carbonic anhydrase [Candidatus Methylomirabilis sp.]
MKDARYATAITCIDGRIQRPVSEWMRTHLNVQYVDTITEPGLDRLLSHGTAEEIASLRKKVQISMSAHGSGAIAVVGHHDCAGNPVSRQTHLEHIQAGVRVAASWGLPVRILGLWVNEAWEVERLFDSAAQDPLVGRGEVGGCRWKTVLPEAGREG